MLAPFLTFQRNKISIRSTKNVQATQDPQRDILVREVGLRDGLQIHPQFMPTAAKLAWVRAEAAAGVPEIEVTSYVPPKLIPQFIDAEALSLESLKIPSLVVAALIPNAKGAERGFNLKVHKLNFVMSVSRTHNEKNVRRSREDSLADFARICAMRDALEPAYRPVVVGGLSTALGCSYEGPVATKSVLHYAEALLHAGADELVIADTVGFATPKLVRNTMEQVLKLAGDVPVGAHFHDTRGTGLANVLAAIEAGCSRFDASLAGLGGCPFAPGATGNIVMDDLCFMLDGMGLRTGVDLEALIGVRKIVAESLPDIPMHGGLARAGLPKGYQRLGTGFPVEVCA
ncbi:MAG: hydroxymethylglutaryl-CoA lyase [Betaproteobacteria bacterium]|nr:hydroxymethylglutaryl-CoA lyase [Betaproteobacteria bacterium]NBP39216.1 hydroxymethylglutaryl-CoA lyase [Betaproteobacteria bacterium]NBQ79506.1 hydroxymethylglutaryl-CoA lyase [Betaproteobacteria bacterium]NBQ94083.1 hydroxymethylglutaryl-CoA lyase [Betaproteobacteria bacterium]NBS40087.1 hydroxymethylglutaryl-CoA lyase [Betaproteobacteria bacterium]